MFRADLLTKWLMARGEDDAVEVADLNGKLDFPTSESTFGNKGSRLQVRLYFLSFTLPRFREAFTLHGMKFQRIHSTKMTLVKVTPLIANWI